MNQTSSTNPPTPHIDPDRLSAFIDGELSLTERQGIEQHLAICHACSLRVLSAMQLKSATARAGHRFAPPPEALARLTASLHAQETQTKPQLHIESTQAKPIQPKSTARISSMRPAAWAALAAAI